METSLGKRLKGPSENEDRISNLPDDVLLHILSFVSTFDSVATCMLSTRWKHLWKHVPILYFYDIRSPFYREKSGQIARFANFVNKVWTLHVSKGLEKLSLTCGNYHIYDIGNWVGNAITRNIHSLYLTIYCSYKNPDHVQLPSNLFTCKTLEVLVLKGLGPKIIVNVPPVVCLPKLKTIEFVGLKYKDDSPGNLISSCVSLESLVVKDMNTPDGYIGFHTISSSTLSDVEIRLPWPPSLIGYNPQIFCSALRRLNLSTNCIGDCQPIRVPGNVFTCKTLEKLILDGGFVIYASRTICLPKLTFLSLVRVEFGDDEIFSRLISSCTSLESLAVTKTIEAELNISSCTLKVIEVDLYCKSKPGHKLVINAPALKRLKLMNVGYVDCQIEDLASLEHADVRISFCRPVSFDYCSSVLTRAYQALQNVKNLTIHQGYLNVGVVEHVLPMFNRLTDLAITINGSRGYVLFKALIKKSIKLENLSLQLHMQDQCWMNDLNPVPACLLSSLRRVSIRCFEGRKFELAVALYLLENSRMMEKMEVCFSPSFHLREKKIELCNKILNVRRGSETCDVVIIE